MAGPRVDTIARECPLAAELAQELRAGSHDLVRRWLDRIEQRVAIDPNRIFPTTDLLDHVPLLIDGIADYIEDPAEEVSTATPVVGKAMELGALRHRQGFDAYEILKEYEILGGIVFNYLAEAADRIPEPCAKSELLVCGHRLFKAIAIIQATTTVQFLRLADAKVAEREDRLRAFNRAVSHEIKNRIGTVLGAADLLGLSDDLTREQRDQFRDIVIRNARAMKQTVENLTALARADNDVRQHRHVRLPEAAKEAARQVREAAQAARIDVRIAGDLPDVEVNAAAVELSLTNYLSNAIKYARDGAGGKFVEIGATIEDASGGREIVLRVRDNGLGVPPDKRDELFHRFFRGHETVTGADGTGLGLSIVKETVEAMGGRAWAEFPDRGSVFAFSLPYRRGPTAERRAGDEPREE